MTYLIENEHAALAVPAAHIARIHPHFREVIAFLATQVADEARHVAFGQAHLQHRVALEPDLRSGVRLAIERRHDVLRQSAGLNAGVRDALAFWQPGRLGFTHSKAYELSRPCTPATSV